MLEEGADVDVGEHLHDDADEERLAAAERVDEEEGRDERVEELGHRVHARQEHGAVGAAALADHGEDGHEVARHRVGARQLREDVAEAGLLHAAEVRGHEERLAEHDLQAAAGRVAVPRVLLCDLSADVCHLQGHSRMGRGQAAQRDQRLQRLVLAAPQHQPARRLVHDEEAGGDDEGDDDARHEPDDLVLQCAGCEMQEAGVHDEAADGQAEQHDDAEPGRQQAADLVRRDLDDGHGARHRQGPDAEAGNEAGGVQGAEVAGRECRDELAGDPDGHVQAQRPEAADAVVDEEGQAGSHACGQVDEGDEVCDLGGVGARRDAERVLESGQ